jgi:hypothetical protein
MKSVRRVLPVLLLLPLAGCVLAIDGDGDNEKLRDRVRELERRIDRLESPWHGPGPGPGQPMPMRRGMKMPEFRFEGGVVEPGPVPAPAVPLPPPPPPPPGETEKEAK